MALTPEGLAVAGAQGFITGGIPGAIQGVALAAISNFAAAVRSPRILQFAGTPKEPLEQPYWAVMRQLLRSLGKRAVEARIATIPEGLRSRERNDQVVWDRAGNLIVREIFEKATVQQIQSVIGQSAETVLETRRILEGGSPIVQEESMVQNVATGVEAVPERVDRGRYEEGLGNELVTQPQPKALSPFISPVIEIGRYIQHARVQGPAIQRQNSNRPAGPTPLTTIVSIPAKRNRQIYVRSIQVQAAPNGAGVPLWALRGVAQLTGTSTLILTHWQVERRDAGFTLEGATFNGSFGSFTVPQGMDYGIRSESFAIPTWRINLNIDAEYIPIGVNGSFC